MLPDKLKIEEIIKELQKIMRIQDWDIEIDFLTGKEFYDDNGEFSMVNHINRLRNYSNIDIDVECQDNKDNWYHNLVHELMHLVTDAFYYSTIKSFNALPSESKKAVENDSNVSNERTVDKLAVIFVSIYPITNLNHILEVV
jgi:hypothetical protein